MPILILDPADQKRLIRRRRAMGGDRYDEVWDGVYIMSPLADNEHQELATNLVVPFKLALSGPGRARVFAGTNVSDREKNWRKNYRCPDVAVFLPGNPAQDRGSHWFGGPDFAAEIISPYDRSRDKLGFYAKVGVRELLLIDRKPWSLELYRLQDGEWKLVGKSDPEKSAELASAVLALTFRLLPAEPRPSIEVSQADGSQRWLV